jgi:hypothetical protein
MASHTRRSDEALIRSSSLGNDSVEKRAGKRDKAGEICYIRRRLCAARFIFFIVKTKRVDGWKEKAEKNYKHKRASSKPRVVKAKRHFSESTHISESEHQLINFHRHVIIIVLQRTSSSFTFAFLSTLDGSDGFSSLSRRDADTSIN